MKLCKVCGRLIGEDGVESRDICLECSTNDNWILRNSDYCIKTILEKDNDKKSSL